ncbi:MAG: hypothetical protein K9J37_14865 [Saprospiraceae bacterium]|nr:hypothetical protein [Saprospiraceae bacterium]MCF8251190.1 hypothetical protein [Saprospiraceae bacterium]MCF8282377.1 hypothetical protein [Bacteroidales bacterium]MCF8313002.1 hypothetical protein [Saprospiraceae bacterium]MCF8441449.1 hypothetical protein [Saprospiraceae bacterium]
MKLLKISILMVCFLGLVASCKEKPKAGYSTVKLNDFFELKMSKSVAVVDNDLKLTFTGVSEDSRCPRYTDCIQEGQVIVALTAVIGGKSQVVEFVRKPSDNNATTVTVGSFKIQLYDVQPYPESGKKINPVDYTARMAVRKAG